MDFANKGNRPAQGTQQPANAPQEQPAQSFQPAQNNNSKKKGGFDFGKFASVFILFAGALLVLAVILGLVFGDNSGNQEADEIQSDKYQAVFLDSSDGQVYFGKMGVFNDDLYVLTDIYYVRVEQPIQPEGANQVAQPNISLAKLGNELHGPQDVMYISRSKVLYWENLKDDGQVVSAITEFKANGGQTTDQTQQQTQEPTETTTPTDTTTETPTDTTTETPTTAPEDETTTP